MKGVDFNTLGGIHPFLLVLFLLLPIHDFRENGSTCITLRQSVSASVRQSVTLLLAR